MKASYPHSESTKKKRTLTRLLRDFLETEASGGVLMMAVTLLAIIFANIDGIDLLYQKFIDSPVQFGIGSYMLDLPLKIFILD